MSFLEMLDVVNEGLIEKGEEPIAFDHDCREGICGSCGVMINGVAHGPMAGTTTCQLHMRSFKDGDDDRRGAVARARLPGAPGPRGGPLAARPHHPGGRLHLRRHRQRARRATPSSIPKQDADSAMDAAQCIGCGACVAACPNASAMLFTAAKVSHLGLLPQGQPERDRRALGMVAQMDLEGFGGCTNYGECNEACPKGISLETIARMNRDFRVASLRARPESAAAAGAP